MSDRFDEEAERFAAECSHYATGVADYGAKLALARLLRATFAAGERRIAAEAEQRGAERERKRIVDMIQQSREHPFAGRNVDTTKRRILSSIRALPRALPTDGGAP